MKVTWRGSTFVSRKARKVKVQPFDPCVADPPDPVDNVLWSLVEQVLH